jgi:hypothetical protein
MGSFYTNLTLRSPDTARIESTLRALRRVAALTPPLDGYTVVFDRACDDQDTEEVGELASQLSIKLQCAVLAVINHDDSALIYELHDRGEFVDHYVSQPEYFEIDESEKGGDAERLARAFGAETSIERVRAVLHPESGGAAPYSSESERHQDLIEVLGMPRASLGYGFDRVEAGDLPRDLAASALVWVAARRGSAR